jgi:hypothetical protein
MSLLNQLRVDHMGADCVEISLSDLVDVSKISSGARPNCTDYYFCGCVFPVAGSINGGNMSGFRCKWRSGHLC